MADFISPGGNNCEIDIVMKACLRDLRDDGIQYFIIVLIKLNRIKKLLEVPSHVVFLLSPLSLITHNASILSLLEFSLASRCSSYFPPPLNGFLHVFCCTLLLQCSFLVSTRLLRLHYNWTRIKCSLTVGKCLTFPRSSCSAPLMTTASEGGDFSKSSLKLFYKYRKEIEMCADANNTRTNKINGG